MVNSSCALGNQRAVPEMHLVEIAADARADRNLVDRLEATDELVVLDDLAHHRLGDGDRGRLRFLGRATAGPDDSEKQAEDQRQRRPEARRRDRETDDRQRQAVRTQSPSTPLHEESMCGLVKEFVASS